MTKSVVDGRARKPGYVPGGLAIVNGRHVVLIDYDGAGGTVIGGVAGKGGATIGDRYDARAIELNDKAGGIMPFVGSVTLSDS